MFDSFKLVCRYYQKEEELWEYSCGFTFNETKIVAFTITSHYKLNHSEEINNDLIFEIIGLLDGENITPDDYPNREVFIWETEYKNKTYRLIFWFKDSEPNHLWVRNCHPVY